MKAFSFTKIFAGFVLAPLCFSSLACSETENKGKRGDEPQCQLECLKGHSEKMAILEKDLSKTGNRLAYQDHVGQEENRYARCLTNCREVLPVK
jgi:hypothetical protein